MSDALDVLDVLDRIDELVATETCWHCGRDFHRTPITQAIDRMFKAGTFDSHYFQGADKTPILCDGSEFIGPLRPEPTGRSWGDGWLMAGFIDDMSKMIKPFNDMAKEFAKFTVVPQYQWPQYHYTTQKWILGVDLSSPWVTFHDSSWNTVWTNKPKPCEEPTSTNLLDIDVEFGPQNWHYEFQRAPQKVIATHWTWSPHIHVAKHVVDHWKDFTAIPTPEPRAYDFSALTPTVLTNTGPKKAPVTKGRKK